jgi:hypothetical protein
VVFGRPRRSGRNGDERPKGGFDDIDLVLSYIGSPSHGDESLDGIVVHYVLDDVAEEDRTMVIGPTFKYWAEQEYLASGTYERSKMHGIRRSIREAGMRQYSPMGA